MHKQHRQEILIIDEDKRERSFLAENLDADGFEIRTATTQSNALVLMREHPIAAVIVDLNGNSLEFVAQVRDRAPGLPIVYMTSSQDKLQRIRAYQRGCDDVIARPFSYQELLARLHRRLARAGAPAGAMLRCGELLLDAAAHTVHVGDVLVELSAKEFALLAKLMSAPERVFTKDELLRDIWGYQSMGRTRSLDTHACKVRTKLQAAGGQGFIVNVWGVGYRLTTYDPTGQPAGEPVPA